MKLCLLMLECVEKSSLNISEEEDGGALSVDGNQSDGLETSHVEVPLQTGRVSTTAPKRIGPSYANAREYRTGGHITGRVHGAWRVAERGVVDNAGAGASNQCKR